MSKVCNSKPQTEELVNIATKKMFTNGNFKINYPPIKPSEETILKRKQQLQHMGEKNLGMGCSKRKAKFLCYCKDPKKRVEMKRRNFIEKLKNIYRIDVEHFNEHVINEIIMKVSLLEKEKRERRERNVDRRMTMISRLLKGQKEAKVDSSIRKTKRKLQFPERVCFEREKPDEKKSILKKFRKNNLQNQDPHDADLYNGFTLSEETEEEQRGEEKEGETEEKPLTCLELIKRRKKAPPETFTRKPSDCVTFEKELECTPQEIIFKDYKKGKVYLQHLKITNVGLDTIHCRYLGILVHRKGEGKFPIGVAVRDNVKLRPGLTCSTKIRLCSPDDTNQLECSIVYETRRLNEFHKTSFFFVLVSCIPARAVVKVTPLKITFPMLTWFAATDPENEKHLKKILKIENVGGKACTCKISDTSRKSTLNVELNEYEGEESVNFFPAYGSENSQETTSGSSEETSKEIYGEDYYLSDEEAKESAKFLVNELIENVFSTFRFSKKYCIEIPPFSVQHIEVRFIPKYKGFHHTMKYVQFEGCDNLKEESLELMGAIKQLPLKIEPQVIDLKFCVINSGVYAGVFWVHNCSKTSYHVRPKIPPSLKKHAHIQPKTTFIQPNGSSTFAVRIYPRITLSKDAPQYFDENSGVLQFPIRVHPSKGSDCSKDYVELYVHALITTYDLELSPSYINFGLVTTVETIRTKVELTNHSLITQEYGFLNLPKGTRVEPNMGFGCILPKETITLDFMYSPVADLCQMGRGEKDVEFDVTVTSIAQYGGFRETLREEESNEELELKSDNFEWGIHNMTEESSIGNSEERRIQEELESQVDEDSSECDSCDDFSTDGEELISKIQIQENEIRKFLRTEVETSKQVEELQQNSKEMLPVIVESEEDENLSNSSRTGMNIIKCRAKIIIPRCHMSETVIQLPPTPYQCFSLYRFKLNGISDTGCMCGLRSGVRIKFKAIFEFLYSHPQIILEPGSGYLREGDSVPVTIIFRPEVDDDRREPRNGKISDALKEKFSKKDSIFSRSNTSRRHSSQKKGRKRTEDTSLSDAAEFRFSAPSQHRKSDSVTEDKPFIELDEPSCFETKVRCVIKTLLCENEREITEVHDIVLICPAIRRQFHYLGASEEINFGTIPVGARSQVILQFQNTSSERLSPLLTLLNPAGPFICPRIFNNVEIDPEHIWRQPLTFAPEKGRADDQIFEINFGRTNILLKVRGEAVEPRYDILPSFECCLLEAKPGTMEEIKLEIMNHTPLDLLFQLEPGIVQEGVDLTVDVETEAMESEPREGSKEKKKTKHGENDKKKIRLWESLPEEIRNNLTNFKKRANADIFTLVGVDGENNFVVPPNEMNQVKIQFWAPLERSDKKYAIRYNLKIWRRVPCKEIIILGRVLN